MSKRKNLVTGAIAGVSTCTLILACSNSNSTTPLADAGTKTDGSVSGETPPGTTPVASAPYAVCTTLEPGSFTTTDGGSYTVPATTSCNPAGEPAPVTATNPADSHCAGVTPQTINGASCSFDDAGPTPGDDAGPASADAGTEDAGAPPAPGPCDENGVDGAYGYTQYGTEADDDDCKYHVSYTASPICENDGTYFVVTANYLTRNGAPLTGASTFAEICLSSTHPSPTADARPPYGNQEVVEGPPGTYTIGPVLFDAPGNWTVRFHFNEFCCDTADDSPHGHAAFFVTVP
jgi:hypothetical protein